MYCCVQVKRQGNTTLLTEISYGAYVIVTWGETLQTHCQGQLSTREIVAAETYLVTVSPWCTVISEG